MPRMCDDHPGAWTRCYIKVARSHAPRWRSNAVEPLSTTTVFRRDMDEHEGFEEDGLLWAGTREELEAWKRYKQRKAVAFVERGYSVDWYPDGANWMKVYLPERDHAGTPETRAAVKFYGLASESGIDGGMVSKLTIQEVRSDLVGMAFGHRPKVRTLFHYDRGPDVNDLRASAVATRLYYAIIEELN